MEIGDVRFRLMMAREKCEDIWHDVCFFIEQRWWTYKNWRRKRNPELVELDAFRAIVELEKKLKKYPNALPLLTGLMNAYKTTDQEEKRLDVMRRLRDIEPPPPMPQEVEKELFDEELYPDIDKALYEKALALVRGGERATASVLQRKLGIGYLTAAEICDCMIDYDVVDFETRKYIGDEKS